MEKQVYTKVKIGADSDEHQTRVWLKGTIKEVLAFIGNRGLTKKPKAEKVVKATKAKKAPAARKEPVAA